MLFEQDCRTPGSVVRICCLGTANKMNVLFGLNLCVITLSLSFTYFLKLNSLKNQSYCHCFSFPALIRSSSVSELSEGAACCLFCQISRSSISVNVLRKTARNLERGGGGLHVFSCLCHISVPRRSLQCCCCTATPRVFQE